MAPRGKELFRTWLVSLLALVGLSLGLSASFAAVAANPTPVCANNVCTVTFTAGNAYSYTPSAGTVLTVMLKGGAGGKGGNDSQAGAAGRYGDTVSFQITSDGTAIGVYPGGAGGNGGNGVCGTGGGAAGVSNYGGGKYVGGVGGNAGPACSSGAGGGGGAASVVTISSVDYVAAGGGGGGGGDQFCAGTPPNAYALANSSANTYGAAGSNGTGDGSGAGAGGGGYRGGNGGGMSSCSTESLGLGGYSGLSYAPAAVNATTTVAANSGNGSVTISYPDKVSALLVPSASYVKTTSVTYTATFGEAVSGLTASDFQLTGTASGCSVSSVTGGPTVYTVNVGSCAAPTGTKTLILALPADAATSTVRTGYSTQAVTAATVTLDDQAPTATLSGPSPVSQTSSFDVNLTASEALAGLSTSNFSISGGSCAIDTVTGTGTAWVVRVKGCTNNDVTTLTLKANGLTDLAGNTGPAAAVNNVTTLDIPPAPLATATAVLSGGSSNGAEVGDNFTVSGATFSPLPRGAVVYNTVTTTWYRCYTASATATSTLAADCQLIDGAAAATYKATQNDVGYFLRGVMTATNATGSVFSATATSPVVREYDILSNGNASTCVVKEGLVYCWGDNTYGQLGNGTTTNLSTPSATPVKLANGTSLTGVVSVDSSISHTCALTNQGATYCWGLNNYSQLGDTTTTNRSNPVAVTATATGSIGFGSGVVAISVTDNSTCAVKAGGLAYCWGYNNYSQLGDGTATARTVPTAVLTAASTPITNVTDIALSITGNCVLTNLGATGQPYCVGYGGYGFIGDGAGTARTYETKVLTSAAVSSFAGVSNITVGSHHVCAVQSGAAFCWGYNPYGQIGTGNTTNALYPTSVINTSGGISLSTGVSQVEASKTATGSTCALKTSGALYCWGVGTTGQLTDGTIVSKSTPTASTMFTTSTSTMALGDAFTCAIDVSGLSCVGNNASGQLGNGTTANSTTARVTLASFSAHLGAVDELPVQGATTETGYAGTGQVLTGATVVESATGSWYGYPLPALTYQWWSCTSTGTTSATQPSGCTAISGATSLNYTATVGDVGKYLRFEVIGTNSVGASTQWSATSAQVGVAPSNTTLPGITLKAGSAGTIVGDSATVTAGTWSGNPLPSLTYKWYRCSSSAATATTTSPTECTFIGDASGSSYTFTNSDVGSYIRGVEVAESSSGINYAYTATVGPVQESRTIAAGLNFTCAIKLGYVYCWGYNASGQLGDGTTTSRNTMPSTPIKLGDGTYLKNVVSIDAGGSQACAITTAGAMYCWGDNTYSQLGDGTTTNRSIPTPVTGLSSGVVGIAEGYYNTCAIKTSGALYCWGTNGYGQIGDNTTTARTTPTATSNMTTGVTQVSLGNQTTCAIKAGSLYCWGYNGNGNVGDGTSTNRSLPTQTLNMTSKVTDVSVGWSQACAVKDGAAYCWGYNASGQLGDGTVTASTSPVAVIDVAGSPAIKLSSGVTDVEAADYSTYSDCFVKQSQKVYCAGENAQGQLATGNTTGLSSPAAASLYTGNVTALTLGRYHSCAIMDNKVSCVGYNVNGELASGTNTTISASITTQTAFGATYGALDLLPISGGSTISGYSGTGQILTGSTTLDSLTGTWVGYSYPTLAYQWLSCASSGALVSAVPGDCTPISGATSATYTPVAGDVGKYLRYEVIGTNSAGTTLAVSASTAAVGIAPSNTALPGITTPTTTAGIIVGSTATATAGTWSGTPTPTLSYNWYRCVGSASTATLTAPTDCSLISGASGATYNFTQSDVGSYIRGIEIAQSASGINYAYTASVGPIQESRVLASGAGFNCVIKLGFVYCWGNNGYGQLGNGTTTNVTTIPSTPVAFSDGSYLKNVVSIDAEANQACAITTAGAMYCWGYNGHGELGDGTTTNRSYPTQVSGLSSGVVGLGMGLYHTCAIKTSGTLWCWGANNYAALGDNTTTQRTSPVQVLAASATNITGVTQVSAGYYYTCAIKNGGAFCWGYNGYNNLGDGSSTQRNYPTQVSGLTSGITDIAAGYIQACAVKNGAAYCWGYNTSGQLGDGTATQRATPVAVSPTTEATPTTFSSGVIDVENSETDPASTCITKQTGKIYCTGYNGYGQLGNGNTTQQSVPAPATQLAGSVTAASFGQNHLCVINGGKVSCVGYNADGEFGNGTTANSTTAATLTGFGTVTGALDVAPVASTSTYTGYTGVGSTLTGATVLDPLTGTWTGYGYPTLSYQWWRCTVTGATTNTTPAGCKAIAGATAISYGPQPQDVGSYLRLQITGTNTAGSATVFSATGNSIGLAPTNNALPQLNNTVGGYAGEIPGNVVTITPGSWTGTPNPTVAYTWYRCLSNYATASLTAPTDCQLIDSATATSYTLTDSDVGYYVRGIETATSTSGQVLGYTQSTALVHESRSITAGDSHTCAIRLGRVYCWGLNTSGQLGDGTTTSRSTAVGPLKLSDGTILENIVSIDAQDTATCAITVGGSMYCWGTESNGEFGDGTTAATTRLYPTQVLAAANTPLTNVIGLAMGDTHTCVIRTGGELWCMGYNTSGQLGDGTATARSYPVKIISSGVQQVSADYSETCAIVASALKCWGINGNGQLGDGTSTNRNVPTQVTGMTSGVTDVSAGYIHTCAIQNGSAFCWGYNAYGQLGIGNATQMLAPTQVVSYAGISFNKDVVNIESSESNPEHTCLTKVGGVLYCFGVGANSALANGGTSNYQSPVASTLWTSGVTEIATGYQYTCVVQNGQASCTGYNNYGQVGNGTVTTSAIANPSSVVNNYAGSLDVLPTGGTVSQTGTQAVGQTLTGATSGWVGFPMPSVTYQWYNCTTAGSAVTGVPADCQAISGATGLTYVATADDLNNYLRFAAVATNTSGTVTSLTAGALIGAVPNATFIERTSAPSGFMPIGTVITQSADTWDAVPAPTVTNAWYRCATSGASTQTAPSDCTLIAGATGASYTTTQNDVGSYIRGAQVATNAVGTTTAFTATAAYVTETHTVAVGDKATCVIKAGEVWCAGVNSYGQLGNNTTTDSTSPVKVMIDATTSLSKVIDVVGASNHFCAITETGALYCWGYNGYGQLGTGNTTNSSKALPVTSGSIYSAVDAGPNYTCAIKVGASLYCWGYNASNQLGDQNASRSTPTAVANFGAGVSQVNAGGQTTCAIKNTALFCWGYNGQNMVGDGIAGTSPRVTPAVVSGMVSGVTDVSVSNLSVCAIKNGAVFCWGDNSYGELATGNTTAYTIPTAVAAAADGTTFTSGVADVESSINVAGNTDTVYVTMTNGSVYSSGAAASGMLLNNTTTPNLNKFTAVSAFSSGVSEISSGSVVTCLIKNGALNCAGLNANGQLLNGTTASPALTALAPTAFASNLGDVKSAPALVTAPTIDPTPTIGNISPADIGAFSGNPAPTLTYQWYSCTVSAAVATSVPGDCVLSTGNGAITANYTPVAADSGKYLRLAVTATNSAGTVVSVSATSTNPIAKGDHSITFGSVANPPLGGAAVTLLATDSASLPITYTSTNTSICTVSNGTVNAVSVGRCVIQADSASTPTYNAAPTATLELYVSAAANVITFAPANVSFAASTVALTGTASSGLAVSYTASPASVCTVSGSNLTTVAVGNCVVTATQAGSATVAAATPVSATIVIGKATQTITSDLPAGISLLNSAGITVTATATSGGTVYLDVLDSSICNFVNGKLVGVSVGVCTVTALQPGDTKFTPASAIFTANVTRLPSLLSMTSTTTGLTNAASMQVAITFDSAVTGFTTSDLSTTPSVCTVSSVTGSGTSYTATLTNCADGAVSLKLAANSVNNGADGPAAAYTSATLFTVDRTAPSVSGVVTVTSTPTNASTVSYTVTFSEDVTGFAASDVTTSGTATGCTPSITAVSASVYTVSLTNCSSGTVGVKIVANSVQDSATNAGPAALYTGTAAVTIDRTAATVSSATTTAPTNTNNATIPFVVTFNEAVTGFTAADISSVGTATGCQYAVTAVSTTAYNVSVTGCADGIVGIKVAANSVTDLAGNASPAADFSSSTVNLDTAAPVAPTFSTTVPAISKTLPISETITFSETVTGFTASDLSITGTATGCQITLTAVSSTVYTASINSCTDGTVGLSLAANSVADLSGNSGPAVIAPSGTITTVDRTPPTVSSVAAVTSTPTNASTVSYTVTFSEAVTDFTAADLTTSGTATGCVPGVTAVSASVYTVSFASCSEGSVGVKIAANSIQDIASNAGPATAYAGAAAISIDRTAATVSSATTSAPAITKTSPIPFVVTFNEAVTGFTAADIATIGSATGCQVAVNAVSSTVYNVSVSACADGTVGIKVLAAGATDLAGNASPAADFASISVTLDTTAPAAPAFTGTTPANSKTLPIVETITFADPVTGFTASDLSITGTATGCQITLTAVSSTVYNASIASCADGTVGLSLAANSVADLAGNAGPALSAPSGTITTLDRVAPAVTSNVTAAAAFTNATPIQFTVTFAEPVTSVTANDFVAQGTATGCQVAVTPVSSTVYTVGVGPCSADGTIGVQVKAASVNDLAGNAGPAAAVSSNTVTLDTIAPPTPTLAGMPGAFTASHAISPTMTMDARYTYSCQFDGTPVSCGAGTINLGSAGSPLADGDHTLTVTAIDQAGNVSVPFSQTFNIGAYQTPLTPEIPTVVRPIRTELDVSWRQPTSSVEVPVIGYTLEYNIDGITWVKAASITDPTQTSYQLTTARSGLEYQFRVRANATLAADSSDFSQPSTFVATYIPEVTSLSVTSALTNPAQGSTVTLTGIDFAKAATTVTFGSTPATVLSVANDGLSAVVAIPAATSAGTVDINVTSGTGRFQGAGLKRGAFTYLPAPVNSILAHSAPTGIKVGASPVSLPATLNSGATPVFEVAAASASICTIANQKLTALKPGTCTYTVAAPAVGNYLAFAAKTYSTVIAKGDNVSALVLPNGFNPASTPINATPYLLAATSSAGLPTSITVGPDAVCYLDALGVFHMLSVGACDITVSSGNDNYNTSSVTTTFNIVKNTQTLNFVTPGSEIPGSSPIMSAAAATDSDLGFLLSASVNSNLPLTYATLDPTICEVDEDGRVTWIPNLALKPTQNVCRISVSQAGDANYEPLAAQTITLTATHVASVKPPGGILTEPEVSGALGRNGGTAAFGGASFAVKVTPTGVTITPSSTGILIGKKTATIKIPYKVTVKGALVSKIQTCVATYGTNVKIPVNKGGMKGKTFTAKIPCKFNADAFKWFKAGNQIKFDVKVVSDRRWPTTGLKVVGKESVKVGKPLYTTSKVYHLTIG